MSRPTVFFDSRAWWQQRRWIGLAVASGVALVAAIGWSAVTTLERGDGLERRGPRALPSGAAAPAPILSSPSVDKTGIPAESLPAASPSTMVAPGVHITPLGVPPGTTPIPAGPKSHDSEPEN